MSHFLKKVHTERRFVDDSQDIKKEVQKIYFQISKRILLERIHFWAELTGLRPRAVSFRSQRSRWGSCSSQGRIVLNLKLIVFEPQGIDYVIVHELCHLAHLNHSKNFWTLVSKYIPNHRCLSKKLKENHWQTSFLEK